MGDIKKNEGYEKNVLKMSIYIHPLISFFSLKYRNLQGGIKKGGINFSKLRGGIKRGA